MMMACQFCEDQVDPRDKNSYKQVIGWVVNRKGGGQHAVALPSEPIAWAHRDCVDFQKLHPIPGQSNLF